jgi:DNA-binding NarL/FixJ family response regulator
MNERASSVFACESQPIVLEGLHRVLANCADLKFSGAAPTRTEALRSIAAEPPDLLLVDLSGGLKSTLQFIADARRLSPRSQAVLWAEDVAEVDSFRAIQYGARGVLSRTVPVEVLLECLRAVAGGHVWVDNAISSQVVDFLGRKNGPHLTTREREIVKLICRGMHNKQIAAELSITPGTVKVHLMHVFEKTGVKDRFELAFRGHHLVEEDSDGKAPGHSEGHHG